MMTIQTSVKLLLVLTTLTALVRDAGGQQQPNSYVYSQQWQSGYSWPNRQLAATRHQTYYPPSQYGRGNWLYGQRTQPYSQFSTSGGGPTNEYAPSTYSNLPADANRWQQWQQQRQPQVGYYQQQQQQPATTGNGLQTPQVPGVYAQLLPLAKSELAFLPGPAGSNGRQTSALGYLAVGVGDRSAASLYQGQGRSTAPVAGQQSLYGQYAAAQYSRNAIRQPPLDLAGYQQQQQYFKILDGGEDRNTHKFLRYGGNSAAFGVQQRPAVPYYGSAEATAASRPVQSSSVVYASRPPASTTTFGATRPRASTFMAASAAATGRAGGPSGRLPTEQREQSKSVEPLEEEEEYDTTTAAGALIQQIKSLPAVIYTVSTCKDCEDTVVLLRKKYELPIVTFYLDKIPNTDGMIELLRSLTGAKTMPQIFICGQFVGGTKEMRSYDKTSRIKELVKYVCAEEESNLLLIKTSRRRRRRGHSTTNASRTSFL